MKAIICTKYGSSDGLKLVDVEKPIPKDNEVLIKTYATTVTTADWRVQSLNLPRGFKLLARLIFGFSAPRQSILGTELSGVIESVGRSVTKFKIGDQVIGVSGAKFGCHAEYKCLSEDGNLVLKPPSLTYEEGASLSFGGLTALDFLQNKGKIKSGERVLVHGASGSVGLAAVQLAKYFGAEVTGVCSAANIELVQSLGATQVIDYTKQDFTKSGETYDIILETVGTLSFQYCKDSLNEGGRLLLVSADLPEIIRIPWNSMTSKKKISAGPTIEKPDLLRFIVKLAEAGKFKAIIDRSYSLEKIAEAYAYVGSRHKKGNVVITV